ncbi:MAG: DUF6495 family protein [Deltaproteobacteria bacterium]
MPKFRLLSQQELISLEKQFIQFLAVNGISVDLWERLKSNDKSRVQELITQFSDLIFERSLNEINLLEYRTPDTLIFYYFEDEKINFIRLEINDKSGIDFSSEFSIDHLAETLQKIPGKCLLYKGRKNESKDKLTEFFMLMESGCKISKNTDLYQFLKDRVG